MRRPLGSQRRAPWWKEILLVLAVYGLYSLTRNTLPRYREAALAHGWDLLRVERMLHIDAETGLNSLLARPELHAVSIVVNYSYALLHPLVTAGVLVALWSRSPGRYATLRTVLVVTTLVSLVGFVVYPVAPPRLLPHSGFVDTVTLGHTRGSWGSAGIVALSNQYAAMPSVHVAWSLWCAVGLLELARSRVMRVVAVCYPAYILLVVLATANHFLLDAVGGAAVFAVATVATTYAAATSRLTTLAVAARPSKRLIRRATTVPPAESTGGTMIARREPTVPLASYGVDEIDPADLLEPEQRSPEELALHVTTEGGATEGPGRRPAVSTPARLELIEAEVAVLLSVAQTLVDAVQALAVSLEQTPTDDLADAQRRVAAAAHRAHTLLLAARHVY